MDSMDDMDFQRELEEVRVQSLHNYRTSNVRGVGGTYAHSVQDIDDIDEEFRGIMTLW